MGMKASRMSTSEIEALIEETLAFFSHRKGFDQWWENIDSEIQEDIKECLFRMYEKEINYVRER